MSSNFQVSSRQMGSSGDYFIISRRFAHLCGLPQGISDS